MLSRYVVCRRKVLSCRKSRKVRLCMKDETGSWIDYADENLDVAVLACDHGHLNACLQNAQQAVEKYLKERIHV
ncbi:MAG: hypothetical protein CVU57_24395 [Deltaproteobacteria bacterium HGW-Deltaproteobacteria-15]|nr:MAG: hypothetical protein CVU57_24395 [Deltaproteobacteria bacterium HGW-Deltaproteobacteria-15]